MLVASGLCLPGALRLLPPLLGMAAAVLGLATLVVLIPQGARPGSAFHYRGRGGFFNRKMA
jgi:hypothetical protein